MVHRPTLYAIFSNKFHYGQRAWLILMSYRLQRSEKDSGDFRTDPQFCHKPPLLWRHESLHPES